MIKGQYVVTVTFTLHDGAAEAFMPLMKAQAENSVRLEEGCHYFDVVHQDDDPNTVFLYEVYSDRAAFDLHLNSNHFNNFDGKVKNLVKDKKVLCFDQRHSG